VKQALAAAEHDPALAAALGLHRAGKLAEAITAYRDILADNTGNANAAFLCGMAALQAGAFEAAASLFTGAIQIDPARADFHANLGLARAQTGDLTAGRSPLIRAALLEPTAASVAFNLGQLLDRLGAQDAAITAFRASTRLQPAHVESWIEYGAAARAAKRPYEANIALLTALRLDDAAPRAWFNIALLRADQSLDADAETGFRRAVELDPNYVEAIGNLGNHLRGLTRRDEARTVLEDGVARHPHSARLWAGLSAVRFDDNDTAQASKDARRAAVLAPSLVDAAANLAQSRHQSGSGVDAIHHGARACLLAPADHRVRFNQATYLLGNGRLAEGWDLYEARSEPIPDPIRQRFPGTPWLDGPPPGRNLLVIAEQGLGDELLFATCFADLDAFLSRGELDSVTVQCDSRLIPLFKRSFPRLDFAARARHQRLDEIAASPPGGEHADCHIHAGSLPRLFRRDLAAFDDAPRPFTADPGRVAHWREFLRKEFDGPVFGLTWRSMSRRDRGDIYYPPIDSLAPIFEGPNIRFVTLQYDDPEPDLREIESRYGVEIIRPPDLDPMNDLDDIAALLTAADGMVSAYTAALNLAGILGVPGYTATYGYYWPTLGTGALPWYPSVRIEMRLGVEDWDAPIQRLTQRLITDLRV
jgi:Tfp pilus assembly protein PilF